MPIDAGGGKRLPVYIPKAKKRKVKPTRAPVTDVQSSGAGYGLKKARKFKKTTTYKQSVGAAKPVRKTDATSSGPGYGKPKAQAFVSGAHDSMHRALSGKPFDPKLIQGAKDLGLPGSKDFKVVVPSSGKPYVVHRHRRSVLPDYDQTLDPRRGGHADAFSKDVAEIDQIQKAGSPVVKVLDQTVRPARAIAGFATEGPKGFKKGLINNKRYSFGKVLKKAGAPAAVAGSVGFVADVATDPTTYVTFGAGSVARNAAVRAGEKAATRAERAGMTKAGQATVRRAAEKKAAKTAPAGKGLTVSFAGKGAPGVTSATAAVGRKVKKVTPRPVKSAGAAVKRVASDVRPQLRQPGVSEVEHKAVRRAGAQARAEAAQGAAEAHRRARAARKLIPKDQYENVIAAVERGDIGTLSTGLQVPARQLRDSYRHAKRVRQRAGVSEGDVTKAAGKDGAAKNYFPHALEDKAKPASRRSLVRKVNLSSSKKRSDLRPIAEQNPERIAKGEVPFSTNLPRAHADYLTDTAVAVAGKHLAANLTGAGRPFKDGAELHPNDVVFHYHNGDLTPLKKVPKASAKNGQYVVLNRTTVEREFANIAPQFDRTAIGALFDKGTVAFKRIATATPGFHARNLVGDTQLAYLAQPGHRIPANVGAASRAVKRLSKTEALEEKTLGRVARTDKKIKIAGKPANVDDFLAGAKRNGVVRSGYIGRELKEQGKGVGTRQRVGGKLTAAGHRVNRWMQNREDLMRLATYKHGLDKGLPEAEAAELSRGIHIDYGDLTKFERSVGRRAVPFYTFSARALPIHAKALVTKPGKFANIEKAREEAALATGLDLGDEQKDLKEFQSRQAPLILKIGGHKRVISDALPLNLLNEIPVGANPGAYITELAQWMGQLANPILKDPVELYANRSFFFRSDLESTNSPLVAAPRWVAVIYKHDKPLAKSLGIVPDYIDRKTGKKTWGWRGKADYIAKSIPGLVNFAQQLATSGTNRRGQSTGQKVLSVTAGVRVEPLDPNGAAMELLFRTRGALEKEANSYARREKTPANVRAATALRAQLHEVEGKIAKLSAERGDKQPLFTRGGKSSPLEEKYGINGGHDLDALAKKYGVNSGHDLDALAEKYGVK